MRLQIALVSILMIASPIACGGSGRADEAEYREAATIAVRDAVLDLSDLPHGWTHSDIGPAALADLQLTDQCAQLNGRGAGFAGEVASEDSEPMTGPKGEELVITVSAFADVASAEAAVRTANGLVVQCKDQIGGALKRAIEVAAEDMGVSDVILDIDGSVEPGSFATFGDETLAYILRGNVATPFGGYDVNGKILIIRDGAFTGVLIYAILRDLDPEDEENLANLLAGKLAQARESLPT